MMVVSEEKELVFDESSYEEELDQKTFERINPVEKISDFFSNYAPSADDVIFEQEYLPIIDFFFILSGYKKFSNDLKNGIFDINNMYSY